MTENNQYCETKLPVELLCRIFGKSETLSPRDILRCRGVCKRWRDAATSFLLQHDFFEIVFKLEHGHRKETRRGAIHCPNWLKFVNTRQGTSSVSDLTQLMSTSPNFPTTSLRFRYDIGDGAVFGDLLRTSDPPEQEHQRDLLNFFLFFGFQIKSLTLPYEFPATALSNTLNFHMQNLERLDLQFFGGFSGSQMLNKSLSTCRLRRLILSEHFREDNSQMLQQLLTASPKLIEIQNVNITALDILLAHWKTKSRCITSFICKPSQGQLSILQEFGILLSHPSYRSSGARPMLREFTLSFSAIYQFCHDYEGVFAALNSILEGCKDTLKILDLRVIPQSFLGRVLKIPPMPKLEFLILSDDVLYNGCPFFTSVGSRDRIRYQFTNHFINNNNNDMDAINARTSIYNDFSTIFRFEKKDPQQERSGIYEDYFPRLHKVQLNVRRDIRSWKKLVAFFTMDCFVDGVPICGDRIPSVTQLEMPCFVLGSDKLSKLFSNICELKITAPCDLQNNFWTTFPLLKKFEICQNPSSDKNTTAAVDTFFTGISESWCLRLLEDPGVGLSLSSAQVNLFIRTQPFIGRCQHLTEFKINFVSRLKGIFASKLTALYGFKEVSSQTRILFSFESLGLSQKGIADMRKWLAPLAPYIQIVT